jgi:hypothetical protein
MSDNNKKILRTTWSVVGYAILLTFGFVWTSIHESAPFMLYMEGLGIGLFINVGKRLAQKAKVFGSQGLEEPQK